MDNFEPIASQSLARPRHICDTISTLDLHGEPCGLCLAHPISFGNLHSVGPIFRISSAWRSRYFRASAYFAVRPLGEFVNKLCFPHDSFEVGFAGGCAEGGVADASVELEDPLVNPFCEWLKPFWWFCFHSSLVVAHSVCSRPVVQSFGLVFGCLHAWDNQRNLVINFTVEFSLILDEK